ncbi:hypothetical protein V3331_08020 [Gaopeijia maritima]|uniref:hypothetical protein n=1 Tax=Gaopeijia maritima TaxID=3119007 RepID=UPI0032497C6F
MTGVGRRVRWAGRGLVARWVPVVRRARSARWVRSARWALVARRARMVPLRMAGVLAVVGLLSGGSAGCFGCTDEGRPAVSLTVLDARTEGEVDADPSTVQVVIRDGAWADSVQAGPEGRTPLAFGRPGEYSLSVTAPGYLSWRLDGVVAFDDRCGVNTVVVRALLEPEAEGAEGAEGAGGAGGS